MFKTVLTNSRCNNKVSINKVTRFSNNSKVLNATTKDLEPLRMLIIGAPGAGKGTISTYIHQDYKLETISTGNILRKHILDKTSLGLKAEKYISSGALVSDKIVLEILNKELQEREGKGWLLDGFPRNISQAESLENKLSLIGNNLNLVINLNVPEDVILNRIQDRWVHVPSGRVYNLNYNPPKVAGYDDITGEKLSKREDDNLEVVHNRLKKFKLLTKPILDLYNNKNILLDIEGDSSDEIYKVIKTNLSNRLISTLQNTFDT